MSGDGGLSPQEGVSYPDAYCDDVGCTHGACNPIGEADGKPECNAWRILGKFSMHAITIGEGVIGSVEVMKKDGDLCPGFMTTPDGAVDGQHCCQRGAPLADAQPALKMTSLTMTAPEVFTLSTVAMANRIAIERDRFNTLTLLSSTEPGEITITTGLGLQHTDGTWELVRGPFEMNGKTWNEDGRWNPQEVPGTLTENDDGSLTMEFKDWMPERPFLVPQWGDDAHTFVSMELDQTAISQKITMSSDLTCGGMRLPSGFQQVGDMQSFLLVSKAMKTEMVIAPGQPGINMCALTAGVESCAVPRGMWQARKRR